MYCFPEVEFTLAIWRRAHGHTADSDAFSRVRVLGSGHVASAALGSPRWHREPHPHWAVPSLPKHGIPDGQTRTPQSVWRVWRDGRRLREEHGLLEAVPQGTLCGDEDQSEQGFLSLSGVSYHIRMRLSSLIILSIYRPRIIPIQQNNVEVQCIAKW